MGYVPLVVHLPARFYSREGRCILLASLLGAVFGCFVAVPRRLGQFRFVRAIFLAVKASSANSLCVAVVIVRAVRAAVVVIGNCRFVHSIKNVVGQF